MLDKKGIFPYLAIAVGLTYAIKGPAPQMPG